MRGYPALAYADCESRSSRFSTDINNGSLQNIFFSDKMRICFWDLTPILTRDKLDAPAKPRHKRQTPLPEATLYSQVTFVTHTVPRTSITSTVWCRQNLSFGWQPHICCLHRSQVQQPHPHPPSVGKNHETVGVLHCSDFLMNTPCARYRRYRYRLQLMDPSEIKCTTI